MLVQAGENLHGNKGLPLVGWARKTFLLFKLVWLQFIAGRIVNGHALARHENHSAGSSPSRRTGCLRLKRAFREKPMRPLPSWSLGEVPDRARLQPACRLLARWSSAKCNGAPRTIEEATQRHVSLFHGVDLDSLRAHSAHRRRRLEVESTVRRSKSARVHEPLRALPLKRP